MSYELSSEAKEMISRIVGIPYEELIQMSEEEQEAYVEKKIGKKISWNKEATITGYPIRTMEDIDKIIDNL